MYQKRMFMKKLVLSWKVILLSFLVAFAIPTCSYGDDAVRIKREPKRVRLVGLRKRTTITSESGAVSIINKTIETMLIDQSEPVSDVVSLIRSCESAEPKIKSKHIKKETDPEKKRDLMFKQACQQGSSKKVSALIKSYRPNKEVLERGMILAAQRGHKKFVRFMNATFTDKEFPAWKKGIIDVCARINFIFRRPSYWLIFPLQQLQMTYGKRYKAWMRGGEASQFSETVPFHQGWLKFYIDLYYESVI